jgi:prophage antirepressor-like protein
MAPSLGETLANAELPVKGEDSMQIQPVQFENHDIRRVYDEKSATWFFSVVDIIQVLTQQRDFQTARKYWNKLKERLKKEGSESVTNCHRLRLRRSSETHQDDSAIFCQNVPGAFSLVR